MFNWIKNKFSKQSVVEVVEEKAKPVIITVHGFGRRRHNEFDNLGLWGKADDYEIIQFDLYDLFDESDHDWMKWVSRAKDVVDEYHRQKRDIYLVGFSMGGVVASYLAAVVPVKKLVLLAPAFSYINMDMITDTIAKSAMSLWSNEKKEEIQIPRSFYPAFTDLIKNLKKYIAKVQCPVLLLHGDEDEVISLKSSIYAYDKIPHDQKRLIVLHKGHHRILMDEEVNWEAYQLMSLFFKGILLPEEKPKMADDILDIMMQQRAQESKQDEEKISK